MTLVVGYTPHKGDRTPIQLGAMLARSGGQDLRVVTVVPAPWPTPVAGGTDREFVELVRGVRRQGGHRGRGRRRRAVSRPDRRGGGGPGHLGRRGAHRRGREVRRRDDRRRLGLARLLGHRGGELDLGPAAALRARPGRGGHAGLPGDGGCHRQAGHLRVPRRRVVARRTRPDCRHLPRHRSEPPGGHVRRPGAGRCTRPGCSGRPRSWTPT